MDYTAVIAEALKVSPFAGVLLYFLRTIWNTLTAKDAALADAMKAHQAEQLQTQRDSITAQNNSASANRELAGAVTALKDHLCETHDEVIKEIKEIPGRINRGSSRRIGNGPELKPAA
jgi:hypothetical protein